MTLNLFNIFRIIGYGICSLGILFSFFQNNNLNAIKIFSLYSIVPLSFMAFLWHTFTSNNIISGSKFFEFQVGGSNLAISIALLYALMTNQNITVIGYILFIYFIYMFIAMLTQLRFLGYKKFLITLPLVSVLGYYTFICLNK